MDKLSIRVQLLCCGARNLQDMDDWEESQLDEFPTTITLYCINQPLDLMYRTKLTLCYWRERPIPAQGWDLDWQCGGSRSQWLDWFVHWGELIKVISSSGNTKNQIRIVNMSQWPDWFVRWGELIKVISPSGNAKKQIRIMNMTRQMRGR